MIHIDIVTPEGNVFSEDVKLVEVKTAGGYIGITANRAPFISNIMISTMYLRLKDGRKIAAAVAGGLMTVSKTMVSIITESFFLSTQLNAAVLEQQRQNLLRQIETDSKRDTKLSLQMEIIINKIKTLSN